MITLLRIVSVCMLLFNLILIFYQVMCAYKHRIYNAHAHSKHKTRTLTHTHTVKNQVKFKGYSDLGGGGRVKEGEWKDRRD